MVPIPLAYLKSQEEAYTAASCVLPGVPTQRSPNINLSLTRALRMILGHPLRLTKSRCWGKYGNVSSIQCTKHLRDMVCAVVAVSNLLRLAKVG